ncbi:MAG: carboxypeptidase-like regulatory domain-containing protein [Bacteroidia bacterium]|nr:carboxypeptidase-like regulatory domain-containing protein [Bacteroidia bacterium]MCZ2247327.1 carboxypeptidase-like regulatory domain-containing protein [Bacteroidia bacterium]
MGQTLTIEGFITEKDTNSTVPFAYVVNKKSGVGTVSSDKGYFKINAQADDTILVSCMGYIARKLAARDILELGSYKEGKKIILFAKTYTLNTVSISPRELSENQKNFYERFINTPMPSLGSPISALYFEYSKEGRERKKLIEIYKKELFFEKAEKRLAYFLSVKKVDLSKFDVRAFIMYCRFSEEMVQYANDYDFYFKTSRCFDEYTGNPDYR